MELVMPPVNFPMLRLLARLQVTDAGDRFGRRSPGQTSFLALLTEGTGWGDSQARQSLQSFLNHTKSDFLGILLGG